MNEEVSLEKKVALLEAELADYRWRDKKAVILKKLDLSNYKLMYDRVGKIKAYEEGRLLTLLELIHINSEADDLMLQGYTFDEISRSVKEWMRELLEEEEKQDE